MSVAELREGEADRRHPLCWPSDMPRTRADLRVWGQFEGTLDKVRRLLLDEIDAIALGRESRARTIRHRVVISTNMRLRKDGEIQASQGEPEDPGVAVYFTRKGKALCFACDKYDRVWKNMRAIQKTIEAMRGIERWGSSQMLERAFTGFAALPASTANGWPTVLGVDSATATIEQVKAARNRLVKLYHEAGSQPDAEKFRASEEAFRDAMQQLGGNLRPTDRQS